MTTSSTIIKTREMKSAASCSAGFTDTGPVRPTNEDAFVANDRDGFYLVVDGVGSSRGAGTAARIAAEVLPGMIRSRIKGVTQAEMAEQRISQALVELGERIHAAGKQRAGLAGMSAAVVGAQRIAPDSLIIFHLGDCRAFRFRPPKCELLTSDHSLLNSLLAKNGDARDADTRYLRRTLTRTLGDSPQAAPEIRTTGVLRGDRILLCSDGLALNQRRVQRVLALPNSAEQCCRQLLALGRSRNSGDNATALVIESGDLLDSSN